MAYRNEFIATQDSNMYENRPLQTLASYAICFIAGAFSAVALGGYTKWMTRRRP